MSRYPYRNCGDPDNFPTFLVIAVVLMLLFVMFGCKRVPPEPNSCEYGIEHNFPAGSNTLCDSHEHSWEYAECISGGAIYQCMCVEAEGRKGPPVVSCAAVNRLPSTAERGTR